MFLISVLGSARARRGLLDQVASGRGRDEQDKMSLDDVTVAEGIRRSRDDGGGGGGATPGHL